MNCAVGSGSHPPFVQTQSVRQPRAPRPVLSYWYGKMQPGLAGSLFWVQHSLARLRPSLARLRPSLTRLRSSLARLLPVVEDGVASAVALWCARARHCCSSGARQFVFLCLGHAATGTPAPLSTPASHARTAVVSWRTSVQEARETRETHQGQDGREERSTGSTASTGGNRIRGAARSERAQTARGAAATRTACCTLALRASWRSTSIPRPPPASFAPYSGPIIARRCANF